MPPLGSLFNAFSLGKILSYPSIFLLSDPADPEPTTPAPRTTVLVAPPAAVDSDSDDEMPPLEDVDSDEPTRPVVSPVPTGVATDEESEWEDDEEYSDEDDSDEDNSYDDENEYAQCRPSIPAQISS